MKKFGCKGSVGLGIPGFVNQSTGIAENYQYSRSG